MLPVRITIDPDDPQPKDVAEYFAAVARRLDEEPQAMRVVVAAPRGVVLDMDDQGRLLLRVAGRRPAVLDVRRRWIADHPVPLDLAGCTTLMIRPVDANRFRVKLAMGSRMRWTATSLVRRLFMFAEQWDGHARRNRA